MKKFSFEVWFFKRTFQRVFLLWLLADGSKSWRESEVRLVEFTAFNMTWILVSLACPISSDVLIHAKRLEESLYVCVYMFVCVCVCNERESACECVGEKQGRTHTRTHTLTPTYTRTHTHTYTHIYPRMHQYVRLFVCACMM